MKSYSAEMIEIKEDELFLIDGGAVPVKEVIKTVAVLAAAGATGAAVGVGLVAVVWWALSK